MMSDLKDSLENAVNALKQERDDLRVQLNLAKLDLRDEWEALEQKLGHLESRLGHAGTEAKDSIEDVGEAVEVLAGEIKEAYKRIRDSLAG